MPTDLDVLWVKLCEVAEGQARLAEKVDQLAKPIKARRTKAKKRIGFGLDCVSGSGISQDPPEDEGD